MSDKTRSPRSPEPEARPAKDDAATSRRAVGRTNLGIATALILAIALMGNYLAFRHYKRWDWTSDSVFTLSDRTRAVVRELDRDLDVYLVLSSAEPNYSDLRELLQRYRSESERITLHFVDPDRDPSGYRVLAERLNLGTVDLGGVLGSDVAVVIESEERRWKISRDDLVTFDFDALEQEGVQRIDVRSEQAITGGILEVTTGRRTKVCLTQGHGEWTIGARGGRDLGALRDEMRRENLELETFATRGVSRVPEDCDALFVVGPTTAFDADEAELLRRFVERGGNLLVAADPELRNEQVASTGLEGMLRDFGIRLDGTVVLELDPRFLPQSVSSPLGPFYVATWGEHELTRPFRDPGAGVLTQVVRSVRPIDENRATTLLSTSEASYAETEVAEMIQVGEPMRGPADIAGPVSIAVATTVEQVGAREGEEQRGGRVVVLGDADIFESRFIGMQEVVNGPLASAIIGWLTARPALIELPGRSIDARPARISQDDVGGLAFRVMFLLPAAIFFLGFAVWWNRRS